MNLASQVHFWVIYLISFVSLTEKSLDSRFIIKKNIMGEMCMYDAASSYPNLQECDGHLVPSGDYDSEDGNFLKALLARTE